MAGRPTLSTGQLEAIKGGNARLESIACRQRVVSSRDEFTSVTASDAQANTFCLYGQADLLFIRTLVIAILSPSLTQADRAIQHNFGHLKRARPFRSW